MFIRNWNFLYSKHSYFCHLQCVGPHWKWTFDRWDLSYPEIQTMRESCTWALWLWPGRTCQRAAQSPSSTWGPSQPHQGNVQLLHTVPKPTLASICASVCIWAMTHSQIVISAPWEICLTWPHVSAPLQQEKKIESWAAPAGMVLAEIEEMWEFHSTQSLLGHIWGTVPSSGHHSSRNRLEQVQRRATKVIRELERLSYKERGMWFFSPWRREGWGALHHSIPVFKERRMDVLNSQEVTWRRWRASGRSCIRRSFIMIERNFLQWEQAFTGTTSPGVW